MNRNEHPNEHLNSLLDIDRIIHEPARLLILAHLFVIDCADFLFLLRQTELTQGNLSSHLNKLESAGYIEIEKQFVNKRPNTLIRLSDKGRQAFYAYRRMLKQALDHLSD